MTLVPAPSLADGETLDQSAGAVPHRVHRARVRPAPVRQPAFDDELPPRHLSLVGSRAAAAQPTLPFDDTADLAAPNPQRLGVAVEPFGPRPTSRSALPDPKLFGRAVVQAATEVLAGRRSPRLLANLVSPAVHAGVVRDSAIAQQARRYATPGPAPLVRSVHVCEPADGVAEVGVVVSYGARCRAVAARLEGNDGRWRCVRLQIG